MIVTFCGHREMHDPESVRAWLNKIVEELIREGVDCFYLGGYGQFDALAASVVKAQKKRYPKIRSVLVLPYLDQTFDPSDYDETLYPPLENAPKRFAVLKRNMYMVETADIVVAFVLRSFGGAFKTLCHAQKMQKRIIRYDNR